MERRHSGARHGMIGGMRLGIAHHFGWAAAVTASADHEVVDRRRIELIEPGMPSAPIHHEGKPLDAAATAALVARVRASAVRATSDALDELARGRGWGVHLYDAKDVEARAVSKLGARADEVLRGPWARIGPPWAKDHRMALAATIVAS